jgi:drug/metabolite transporter superfamily protein YnfA
MRKPVLITVGVVIAAFGAIFTLQGLGLIGGSAMTGSTLWAILGPIIAVAGIALVVFGMRRGSKP